MSHKIQKELHIFRIYGTTAEKLQFNTRAFMDVHTLKAYSFMAENRFTVTATIKCMKQHQK